MNKFIGRENVFSANQRYIPSLVNSADFFFKRKKDFP